MEVDPAIRAAGEFLHGERLPRQAPLDEEQVLAREEADVGGDHVACGEFDQIPRHEFADRFFHRLAVAQHRRLDADHGPQFRGRVVGPGFLHEPQHHPEQHHQQHDDAALQVSRGKRNRGKHQQQHSERIDDRFEEEFDEGVVFLAGDHVGPILFEPALGLVDG